MASAREVNHRRDENGLTYARKSIVRIGLTLNVNCCWEESQLFLKFQEIIYRCWVHFDGLPMLHETADDFETGVDGDTLRS